MVSNLENVKKLIFPIHSIGHYLDPLFIKKNHEHCERKLHSALLTLSTIFKVTL